METLIKPVKIKVVPVFATPDSMEDLQDYLAKFSGSNAVAANVCAFMAWNLAAKLTNPNGED